MTNKEGKNEDLKVMVGVSNLTRENVSFGWPLDTPKKRKPQLRGFFHILTFKHICGAFFFFLDC